MRMKRVRSSPGRTASGGVSSDGGGGRLGCCCPTDGGGRASVDDIKRAITCQCQSISLTT